MNATDHGPTVPAREPWTRWVHLVPALALALFILLGSRPGGELAIRAYRVGIPTVGLLAAFALACALGWSLLRRPILRPGRALAFVSLGATLWMASFPLAYPSSHDGRFSVVRFELPVRGEWRVRWGGAARRGNALVLNPSRRHGFDLVRVSAGRSEDSVGPEETGASEGEEVFAPAAGRVVRVVPERGGEIGSHLVVRVAPEEFLFLGGLDPTSIEVEEGQEVRAGERLARVGNTSRSRLSPQPHLALHLQDAPVYGRGEAIPMRFHEVLVNDRESPTAVPVGGLAAGRHVGDRIRSKTGVSAP